MINFSYNKNPSPESNRYIAALPKRIQFRIRDEESLRRFEQFTGKKAKLAADISFLLPTALVPQKAKEAFEWKHKMISNGRLIIGLNPSKILINALHVSPSTLAVLYAELIHKIHFHNPRFCFLVMGHDLRGNPSGIKIAKEIEKKVSILYPGIDCLAMPFCSAQEKRLLMQGMHLLICGRMHLAIAALCEGIPVAGIEYQDKFTGLFNFFGLQSYLLQADEAFSMDLYFKKIQDLLDNREQLSQQIKNRLSYVQSTVPDNFK